MVEAGRGFPGEANDDGAPVDPLIEQAAIIAWGTSQLAAYGADGTFTDDDALRGAEAVGLSAYGNPDLVRVITGLVLGYLNSEQSPNGAL